MKHVTMKLVTCKSGMSGFRDRLHKVYVSFDEFKSYANVFGLHTRLGFATPELAWKADPLIEYSVNPSDYRKVR